MTVMPKILGKGRARSVAKVILIAIGQAAAAGVAAFSTRDVFASLHAGLPVLPAWSLGLIAFAGIAIAGLRVREQIVAERLGQDYASDVRLVVFDHLSRLSARDLDRRRRGGLALRFVGDLAAMRNWVSFGIARVVSASVVLPLATLVLFVLDPRLGAIAAMPIALGLGLMAALGRGFGKAHGRLRDRRSSLAARMSERAPYAPELRMMGRMRIERRTLRQLTERMIASAMDRAQGVALLRAMPDAVAGLAAAGILFAAGRTGAAPAEAAGALAALALMVRPMRDLANVWDRRRAWLAAKAKCETLLSVPVVRRNRRSSASTSMDSMVPPAVRFEEVCSFSLERVSATAAGGRRVAIVGRNGAGKSTLLSLAAGLDVPSSGSVRIGDCAPTSLAAKERRRILTFVGDRTPILAGALRRALTMGGAARPCDATIYATARAFGLDDVLERIGGLDARVSEGARNLSSGEVRRLLLARAALCRPQVLLLDEPDASLDVDGSDLIVKLLCQTQATALIATHNPDLARRMDEVWLLENGRLIEAGPADLVLQGNGPTAHFFARKAAV
jgi:ABC-type multidrug transport system fused ATPase/permease subunit